MDTLFSSYKIFKSTHNAAIKIMPEYGPLETFGSICLVWIVSLIPVVLLSYFLRSLHLSWYIFLIISIVLAIFLIKKFAWNFWGFGIFYFDKNGFFVSGIHLNYAEIKTIEIHEVDNQKLFRLHFIMQRGDVIPVNVLCTSQQILEELGQVIISQSLSKGLEDKNRNHNGIRGLYDRFFSTRLNRKNYTVGSIIFWLLIIDLSLLSYISDKVASGNSVIYYTIGIFILIVILFDASLVIRRTHDIAFAANDRDVVNDSPLPAWYFPNAWMTIKLFFMESAKYETQHGKIPTQNINLSTIFGLRLD